MRIKFDIVKRYKENSASLISNGWEVEWDESWDGLVFSQI